MANKGKKATKKAKHAEDSIKEVEVGAEEKQTITE